MRLDHASPVPLYHQAATCIEEMIASGAIGLGEKLEGEVELAERLGVSRPTIRAALTVLVDKGLLVRRRGYGTVVAAMPITRPLALTSLHDDLIEAGRTPRTEVLEVSTQPCPEEARGALQLTATSETYVLRRLRFADEEPIALMRNTVRAEGLTLSRSALQDRSLYHLLGQQGIRLYGAHQRIGATSADPEQSRHLQVEQGAALVQVVRTSYDAAGTPIEYAHLLYPAHSYSVEMTLMER
ncbi:GntR family transcriptional regulator [Egibacter rhizosphaerae]|uniref:GntR family transcriptional regulator n=1 Tax=Egibacter rhizosphaerae TaxID=1670831 RepID=A0A411YHY9_9ACTN|nr:GntR family transcriptional regulator [Egibacter rhizosphaerae]QBI20884.1 GntR family transcriptional regulator [Egibacter rhizosphaerae]